MLIDLLTTSLAFLVPHKKSVLFQLILAVVVACTLLFIKIWVPDIGRYSPFLLFSVAIILCGWFAGLVSSITLTLLSSLLVSFVLITPFGLLNADPVGSIQAGIFIVESFFLSLFVEYVKRLQATYIQQSQLTKVLFSLPLRDAVIIVDSHNIIAGWSSGAQKLFGYKEEEIKGKPFALICDKKNWFDYKSNILRVRVYTRIIYSKEYADGIKVKILMQIPKKNLIEPSDTFAPPVQIPAQAVSPILSS